MKMLKQIENSEVKNFRWLLKFASEIHWHTVALSLFFTIGGVVGLYHLVTGQWQFLTFLWNFHTFILGGIGTGIAGHRLFCHRSFKVTRGLKRFLIFCHTVSGQYTIINWVAGHRAHHRYTDTDKDPTNIKKGALFSHIFFVWWIPPEVKESMNSVDMSDLTSDKDVMFQYKFYLPLHAIFAHMVPVLVPYFLWREALWIALFANALRLSLNFNQVAVVNSLTHMYGTKPYDSRISACDNKLAIFLTAGEGYHNYHHVFPWDYKTAEFGDIWHFNISAIIIDFCHKLGWVTDRKVASPQMITKRKARTGDGTHWIPAKYYKKDPLWGCGDRDVDVDDKMDIHAYYKDDYFKEL